MLKLHEHSTWLSNRDILTDIEVSIPRD